MNIIFINRLAGTTFGGGENFILNIAKELNQNKHYIKLITGMPMFKNKHPLKTNYQLHIIKTPYLRYIGYKYKLPFPWIWTQIDEKIFSIRCFQLLRSLYAQQNQIDIVITTGFYNLALKIKSHFKIPVIVWVPGIETRKINIQKLQKISNVISNGDAYHHLKKRQIKTLVEIPLGIEKEFLKHPPIEKINELHNKYNLNQKIIVLFVGRFTKIKNLPLLFKSFAIALQKIPNLRLLLVGEGEQKNYLKQLAVKLKIKKQIVFAGVKHRNEIALYYSISDIFVLPSKYDNLPQVINEAMISKLPIIATNTGGIPMQVKSGFNGFLIESNNIQKLANKIILLSQNPCLRKKMGQNGYVIASKNYSWKKAAQKLECLCQDIIKLYNKPNAY